MQSYPIHKLRRAALGLGLLAAQAAQAAPDCGWQGAALRPLLRPDAGFAWHAGVAPAQAPSAAKPPAPPAPPAPSPLRIALWGDSLTSAPDFVDAALDAAGIDAGAIQPSFIQAGVQVAGLRLPLKSACASAGWQTGYAHKENPKKRQEPAWYGQGFVSMRSTTPGDSILLDFRSPSSAARVTALTIVFEKARPDGSLLLGVAVDGGAEQLVPLSRSSATSLRIVPDAPMAALRIRLVSGQVTLHGFAPVYREAPRVVLDSFSVPGGMLRSWAYADEHLFAAAPGDYRLVLVQYGTNEGAAPRFSRADYLAYLRSNLGRMRKLYPQARCMLIGPPDRGVPGAAGPAALKYANVHQQIAQAQKQAGQEAGCDFWDWQAAMGGPGAAARWAGMQPPRMQKDQTHLTAKGYQLSGRMFGQAMLTDKH